MAKLTDDQLARLKAALQQRYLELRERFAANWSALATSITRIWPVAWLIPVMRRLLICWWI